jgi:agmatine deiminase
MKSTPGVSGFKMPAEWAKHRATWIAFPHHRTDFPGKLHAVGWTFAEMARVLSTGEQVQVLVQTPSDKARVSAMFKDAGVVMDQVSFVVEKTNRSWTRDTMPIWLKKGPKQKLAVNFRFDGWSRYRDHKDDDAAP